MTLAAGAVTPGTVVATRRAGRGSRAYRARTRRTAVWREVAKIDAASSLRHFIFTDGTDAVSLVDDVWHAYTLPPRTFSERMTT